MTNEYAKVSILDREFAVACGTGEKPALLKAARMLDQRMRALRNQGASTRSFDQLLVVVALNLCNEQNTIPATSTSSSTSAESSKSDANMADAISADTVERLIKKIDEALS